MRVRPATLLDVPHVVQLMRELAAFEKLAGPDAAAEARLAADLGRRFDAWVADADGDVVGYALVFETYSTFAARPLLYLEDLYVTPTARRAGVATVLFRRVAQEAASRGCARLVWAVLDWNVDAKRFYERLGAARTAWETYVVRSS
jgi:GNAT superfamily N-acetyltransferase